MTAQQLKNSILLMAVQGKLVPQDPNDEPASVLLERIHAEKERLIKEKKIKREKNPSVIFKGADNTPYEKIGDEVRSLADEVPFDIPDSWEWVTLKSIAISSLGKTLDKAKNKGELKPYLCSINVYWDGIDLTTVKEARLEEDELPKYLLKPGDLLICEGGDVGRSAVWESTQEMYYQNALHRVRFYGGINPYFFQLLLECYKGNLILDTYSKGMTIKHLVQTALNAIIFPLPPLAEQNRIVDAINGLLPFLRCYDRAEKKLTALNTEFPEALKKSILQEAVQGKLVPQDPSDEPAEALLERIRVEKQRLIKEGKIKKDKHESVIFRRDNSHYEKRGSEEVCIDDEIPFEVPSSWALIRLDDIGIYRKGPFGSSLTKSMFVPKGADTVKVYEQKNAIQKDHTLGTYYITRQYYESKMRSFTVEPGDILVSCAGTIGETYVLPERIELGIINQALMRMTIFAPINLDYFLLYFDYVLKQTAKESSKGSAIKNIPPFEIFKKLILPLPPLEEQKRIVEKVRELESLCNSLCT